MIIVLIISVLLFLLLTVWRERLLHPAVQTDVQSITTDSTDSSSNKWLLSLVSAGIILSAILLTTSIAQWLWLKGLGSQVVIFIISICGSIAILSVLIYIIHAVFNSRRRLNQFSFLRKSDVPSGEAQAIEDNEALEILSDEEEDENDPAELFENALALYEIEIIECLIPRKEIVGVELAEGYDAIRKVFIESKHSKLIVYENDMDNILGYVHHSDFYTAPSDFKEENLEGLVREISAVPASMTAIEMLSFFKRKQKSIAWVVDEFGGTEGILTTEDLLEELFGEIEDEHDHSEYIEQQISEDEFILSGRLEVEYINDKFKLDLPTESAETLSGYIIEEHNAIPEKEEKIIIAPYEFKILKVSKTRIETVRLKIIS